MSDKRSKTRKTIIASFSAFLLLALIFFISFAIIYHPRSISKYIYSNNNDLNKIEIVNCGETLLEIDKDKSEQFLSELFNIKVTPSYLFIDKVVSSYSVNIYYEADTYQINNNYIDDGENRTYIKVIDNKLYHLVKEHLGDTRKVN